MNTLQVQSHGKTWDFDKAKLGEEFKWSMIAQGLKIRLDRSSSQDKTASDRLASCQRVYDYLVKGELPKGGGGGGPQLSVEDAAALAWFRQTHPKQTFVGSKLERYWADLTRETMIRAYVEKGKTEAEIRALVANEDFATKLVNNVPAVKAAMYKGNAKLKKLVEAEKSKRLSKQAPDEVEVAVENLSL